MAKYCLRIIILKFTKSDSTYSIGPKYVLSKRNEFAKNKHSKLDSQGRK